jgi:hypothetical protein
MMRRTKTQNAGKRKGKEARRFVFVDYNDWGWLIVLMVGFIHSQPVPPRFYFFYFTMVDAS